jgi:hypothetical protein
LGEEILHGPMVGRPWSDGKWEGRRA